MLFHYFANFNFWRIPKDSNFDKGALDVAHKLTKRITNVKFVELRKIHYNVMSRVMDMNEADILAGRAKSVSARHSALYELDRLTDAYHRAWEKLGIMFSDMLIWCDPIYTNELIRRWRLRACVWSAIIIHSMYSALDTVMKWALNNSERCYSAVGSTV